MGKYERKREKKSHKWIWVVFLLLLVAFLAIFVMPQVLYRMNEEPIQDDIVQSTATQEQNEETVMPTEDSNAEPEPVYTVEFPVVLDEGNIEIESLFQFSGVNPDAGNQKTTDVASIVLKNTSGQYLREATVNATLDGGAELTFIVTELPAGASVMAFSIDNVRLLETDLCTAITVTPCFEDVPNNESVEISVDGMTVTVTNISSEDLNEIDVYYRDVFNDKYFGGMTYSYIIEKLTVGESTTFTAEESLLGVIEVVRVAVNDKN